MTTALLALIGIIVLALIFDFINGFHDTANAIATSVATKVLTPAQAILMAAVLNVVGALTGTAVAKTVYKDIISPDVASLIVGGGGPGQRDHLEPADLVARHSQQQQPRPGVQSGGRGAGGGRLGGHYSQGRQQDAGGPGLVAGSGLCHSHCC